MIRRIASITDTGWPPHFQPGTRLSVAGLAILTCLLVSPIDWVGLAMIVVTVAVTLLIVGVSPNHLRKVMGMGMILYLPFFLITPWVEAAAPGMVSSIYVPWQISIRGFSTLLISVTAYQSVSPAELFECIHRIFLPRPVKLVLWQIVYQIEMLTHETRLIIRVMSVRGLLSRRQDRWQMIFNLPRVWLPRLIFKAERIGTVMEIRGLPEMTCPNDAVLLPRKERVIIILAVLGVVVAAIGRWGIVG